MCKSWVLSPHIAAIVMHRAGLNLLSRPNWVAEGVFQHSKFIITDEISI